MKKNEEDLTIKIICYLSTADDHDYVNALFEMARNGLAKEILLGLEKRKESTEPFHKVLVEVALEMAETHSEGFVVAMETQY